MRPPESRADDAPSGGATAPVSNTSPGEDAAMEVDEGAIVVPPTSPVSREDMISSMRMRRWEWRQAWPTSQCCLLVDKSWRVRAPPSLRHLPLRKTKKSNCRSCRPLSRGLQRRSWTDDPKSEDYLMTRRQGANHQQRPWSDPSWRPVN